MRKLLLFIIPIFILACSEDKDVKVYKPASTISIRSGTWSIAGGKDTYVLGEQLGVRISSGGDIPPNIHSAVLEMKIGNNSHYIFHQENMLILILVDFMHLIWEYVILEEQFIS